MAARSVQSNDALLGHVAAPGDGRTPAGGGRFKSLKAEVQNGTEPAFMGQHELEPFAQFRAFR